MGLRQVCLNLMLEDIEIANLVQYWQLGETYHSSELCFGCADFAADHIQEIAASSEFREFRESDSVSSASLIRSINSRMTNLLVDDVVNMNAGFSGESGLPRNDCNGIYGFDWDHFACGDCDIYTYDPIKKREE